MQSICVQPSRLGRYTWMVVMMTRMRQGSRTLSTLALVLFLTVAMKRFLAFAMVRFVCVNTEPMTPPPMPISTHGTTAITFTATRSLEVNLVRKSPKSSLYLGG